MALTFAEYWMKRNGLVAEMAQSSDPAKAKIPLDEKDEDFVAQAIAAAKEAGKTLTPPSILRILYTTVLRNKIPDGGVVPFIMPGRSREKYLKLKIARTHLQHIQDKLRAAGFDAAAEHGFHPHDVDPKADGIDLGSDEHMEKAFSKQNANAVWAKKALDVNYSLPTGTRVKVAGRGTGDPIATSPVDDRLSRAVPGTITHLPEPIKTRDAAADAASHVLKPVPKKWSDSHMRTVLGDKDRGDDHLALTQMKQLGGSKDRPQYDFSDVWRHVQTLVGDVRQPGKHILPEVWAVFQRALPEAGNTIFAGVRRKLMEFSPDILESPMQVKQALMQTTAMILSDPTRGNKRKQTGSGDFLHEVEQLMRSGPNLASFAASMTAQGYLRKSAGINTNNMRKGEIGGTNQSFSAAAQPNLDDMGTERDLDDELDRKHGHGDEDRYTGPAPAVDLPKAGMSSPEAQRIAAQLKALEPQAQKVIAKLDAAHWNMSAVSDDEWEIYTRFEKLEKALERAKNAPPVDHEDTHLPAAAAHHFRRNEVAGAGTTLGPLDLNNPDFQVEGDPCSQVILGFNAWCKKRDKKKDGK